MPVSNPGYFGATRTTDRNVGLNAGQLQTGNRVFLAGLIAGRNSSINDFYVIGSGSAAGGWTDANADGAVVIGSNNLPATNPDFTTGAAGISGAPVLIGANILASIAAPTNLGGAVAIGVDIARQALGGINGSVLKSVLIGNGVLQNNTLDNAGNEDNVIIGHKAARRLTPGVTQYVETTIIGSQSGPQHSSGGTVNGTTVLGARAAQQVDGVNNVIIGRQAGNTLTTGTQNVVIGQGAELGGAASTSVVVGSVTKPGASNDSVFLGASQSTAFTGARIIAIGRGAAKTATNAAASDQLFIETDDAGGTRRTWLYGSANGNLVVGNAAVADRDLGTIACTNGLKIPNGTRGAGNPANGGFFYALAGALHWVGSGGTDTVIAPA